MDAIRFVIDLIRQNPIAAAIAGVVFLLYGLAELSKGEAIRFVCVCAALVISVPLVGLTVSAIQLMMAADWHISLGY